MGKINYEHMDKAAELIAAFHAELKDICGKYEELMSKECPENIADPFDDCEDYFSACTTGIQLYGINDGYTSEELIADGFYVSRIKDKSVWYEKEYKGTNIVIGIDYGGEGTADES